MPLVRITLAQGRSPEERRAIADGVHQAPVETAAVPADDRFQSVHEVAASDLHWSESYLGLRRTPAVVFVQIFLTRGDGGGEGTLRLIARSSRPPPESQEDVDRDL